MCGGGGKSDWTSPGTTHFGLDSKKTNKQTIDKKKIITSQLNIVRNVAKDIERNLNFVIKWLIVHSLSININKKYCPTTLSTASKALTASS